MLAWEYNCLPKAALITQLYQPGSATFLATTVDCLVFSKLRIDRVLFRVRA